MKINVLLVYLISVLIDFKLPLCIRFEFEGEFFYPLKIKLRVS